MSGFFRLVFTLVKPSAVPVVLLEVNITKSKTANRSVKKSWLTRRAEPDLIGSGTGVCVFDRVHGRAEGNSQGSP